MILPEFINKILQDITQLIQQVLLLTVNRLLVGLQLFHRYHQLSLKFIADMPVVFIGMKLLLLKQALEQALCIQILQ